MGQRTFSHNYIYGRAGIWDQYYGWCVIDPEVQVLSLILWLGHSVVQSIDFIIPNGGILGKLQKKLNSPQTLGQVKCSPHYSWYIKAWNEFFPDHEPRTALYMYCVTQYWFVSWEDDMTRRNGRGFWLGLSLPRKNKDKYWRMWNENHLDGQENGK